MFTKSYSIKIIGYCYHLVKVIIFSLAQSDHIKWLQLYNNNKISSNIDLFVGSYLIISYLT